MSRRAFTLVELLAVWCWLATNAAAVPPLLLGSQEAYDAETRPSARAPDDVKRPVAAPISSKEINARIESNAKEIKRLRAKRRTAFESKKLTALIKMNAELRKTTPREPLKAKLAK